MIPPKIDNAPGLTWRPRKHGPEARWRARTDLVRRGYRPAVIRLWAATETEKEPSPIACEFIAGRCVILQNEMLSWGHGGLPTVAIYDGTLKSLIACYQSDPVSTYHKLRYVTRDNYDGLCRRIEKSHGADRVGDTKYRTLLLWHQEWTADGKVAMGHSLMGMLRTLIGFGATILEDDDCARVAGVLHRTRFPQTPSRTLHISAEQAALICAEAHRVNCPSIALAQAFQFECMLRQKDVIGEWVPVSEPGISEVIFGNEKWLRGIRWEEIDANLVLHHITSKKNKLIEPPLREAQMVMKELCKLVGIETPAMLTRDMLPAKGPVIMHDRFGVPWVSTQFRRRWREMATACKISTAIFNMDSRAGGISEATDAGADLEHVRHAATHSDIAMTQRYSRNSQEKVAGVMRTRAAHRNKTGTPST